jgi:hypothetical protein
MRCKILLLLFVFRLLPILGQDTLRKEVKIVNGSDTIILNETANFKIHTSFDNDSINEHIQVFNLALLRDSVIIEPGSYDYNSYKQAARKFVTINHFPNSKDRITIPISHIDYIKRENRIKDFMQPTEIISAIAGLLVAPLVSLGKPFKIDRYYVVAGTSVAIFAISLTIDNIWGHTIFRTRAYKNKNIWTIQ